MIITLTLNPSIDYTLTVNEPLLDIEVNRTTGEQMKVGGKGLNVSMMLIKLQIPSRAIALLGGFTGDYIEQALRSYPRINLTRVPVEGMNRINVKLYHGPGTLCVNARGPEAGASVRRSIRAGPATRCWRRLSAGYPKVGPKRKHWPGPGRQEAASR